MKSNIIFITAPHQISNSKEVLVEIPNSKVIVRLAHRRDSQYYNEIMDDNSSWSFNFVSLQQSASILEKVIGNLKIIVMLIVNGALVSRLLLGDPRTIPGKVLIRCRSTLRQETEILCDGNFIIEYSKKIDRKYIIIHSHFDLDLRDARVNLLSPLRISKKSNNSIIMLGSPFVEYGYCELKEYLSFIKSMMVKYGNRFLYYPHRAEMLSSDIKKILGPSLVIPTRPFEVYVETFGCPAELHGFYSTALFNLRNMYHDMQIVAHKIPLVVRDEAEKNEIAKIYNLMEKYNIEVRQNLNGRP